MNVWAVVTGHKWEGEEVQGVYDNPRSAQAHKRHLERKQHASDWYCVINVLHVQSSFSREHA